MTKEELCGKGLAMIAEASAKGTPFALIVLDPERGPLSYTLLLSFKNGIIPPGPAALLLGKACGDTSSNLLATYIGEEVIAPE